MGGTTRVTQPETSTAPHTQTTGSAAVHSPTTTGPAPPSGPTTKESTGTETQMRTVQTTVHTTATAPRRKLSDRKVSDVGFGYYGMTPDYRELDTDAVTYMKTDHTNTMIIGSNPNEMIYTLQQAKETNCRVWVNVDRVWGGRKDLGPQWQDRFDEIDRCARESGAYECLLGYYLDEPLLNRHTREDVYTLTKYNHDHFGKRFFICYAVSGIAPEEYFDPNCSPPLTPETATYITDIGFDMYWEYAPYADKYDRVIQYMKQRVGRDDVKIWYIPWAYVDDNADSETMARLNRECTIHIEAMYAYLKKERNPGGLMVFLYDGSSLGFAGIRQAGDREWKTLRQTCERIGREICTDKME